MRRSRKRGLTRARGADECRPYGKDGAQVCYGCAMATPEAKAEAERQMGLRLFGKGKA